MTPTLTDPQREAIASRVIAGEHPAVIASLYGKYAGRDRVAVIREVSAYAHQVLEDFRPFVAGEGAA